MSYRNIGPEEFGALMEDENNVVLDVRSPMEIAEGCIPGYVMVNMFEPDFVDKIRSLDKDKGYLVYCRSGNRSASVCGFMANLGFKNLYNLDGGIMAWNMSARAAS